MADNVSPTGEPMISQRVLRVLLSLYAMLGAVNGAMAGMWGIDSKATKITFLVLVALAPLIGVASPGLRKPPTA